MMINSSITRTTLVLTLFISGMTVANAGVCEDGVFHTTDAGRMVTFVDHKPEGTSIGDQRIGQKDILDADGNKVGVFRWIATVVQLGEGDEKPVYAVNKYYEFEDGILFGASIDNTKSPVGNTEEISIVSGHTAIKGGVGNYAGVTGKKHHKRHPDSGKFTYFFDLDCN